MSLIMAMKCIYFSKILKLYIFKRHLRQSLVRLFFFSKEQSSFLKCYFQLLDI